MKLLKILFALPLLFSLPVLASSVYSKSDLLGQGLVTTGGAVNLYFVYSDAAYDSTLSVLSPTPIGPIFPNHATAPGTKISLGNFASGIPIILRLNVLNTGDYFFTGPASANPDGIVHAALTAWHSNKKIPANGILVSFEDLFGGGDKDYNDFSLVITGVSPIPEPATFVFLLIGLSMLGFVVNRKNKQ